MSENRKSVFSNSKSNMETKLMRRFNANLLQWTANACLLLLICLLVGTNNSQAQNPTQLENSQQGDTDWKIMDGHDALGGQISGYASKTSVNVKETIGFHINVNEPQQVEIKIYRMGWYQGAGARLIDTITASAVPQLLDEADHTTGLIECNWSETASWYVPKTIVSGVFIAKIKGMTNLLESYIIFVVRNDSRNADYVFQTAVTTYQAYNNYPYAQNATPNMDPYPNGDWTSGRSLYASNSFGPDIPEGNENGNQAREVSFNRPYMPEGNIYLSAGQFFRWEYNMVRWMESPAQGYDVTYITDIDTHMNTNLSTPGRYKVFLSVGHDEYWSWEMRDNIEQARNRTDQPLNLGFFGGNISHWQIRFKNSSTSGTNPANAPNRTIVAYKGLATSSNSVWADPFKYDGIPTNNYLITAYWRDNKKTEVTGCPSTNTNCNCPLDSGGNPTNCTKRPEDEMVGVMTDKDFDQGHGDFTFTSTCPAWVKLGMANPNQAFTELLGYEADRIYYIDRYATHANWIHIAHSTFINGNNSTSSDSVFYRYNGNARVFAAGTVQWSWGVDNFGGVGIPILHPDRSNSDVEVVTRNILLCLKDGGTACP